MEPKPDPIDLSVLDPSRDPARWEAMTSRVAARAVELRRWRRAVMRRGVVALAVAAAAALLLWLTAPRRPAMAPRTTATDVLDWAIRDVDGRELLERGVGHAH